MSNKYFEKHLSTIKSSNTIQTVKLRAKPINDGALSLYLDLWKDGRRSYEFLKIKLGCNKDTYKDDEQKIFVALSIRDNREKELLEQKVDFNLTSEWKKDADFYIYMEKCVISTKTPASIGLLKHFKKFINKRRVTFKDLDNSFCKDFKEYLANSNDIKKSTAGFYLQILKSILNQAISEKIINENPCKGLSIKSSTAKREFLIESEIIALIKTPMPDKDVCNAFLFSCCTGLRISDLTKLSFENIQEGIISFRQKKTQQNERIKMSDSALQIYNFMYEEKKGKGLVFKMKLGKTSDNNNYIKKWVLAAGINKKITFHCGRHTFATLCLTHDVEIYTVSKLLGHRDLKTTQIYAKLIDLKKDEAVSKLPDFFNDKK